MHNQDTLEKLEKRVDELEPRLDKLESDFAHDIKNILELLKKIELRVGGGGINDPKEMGLIVEVRDIKTEITAHKAQLKEIQDNVQDIKDNLPKMSQLSTDITTLQTQMGTLQKYKWMVWGGALTLGWLILNYSGLIGGLKALLK